MLDSSLEGEARLRSLSIKRLTDGTDLAKHFDALDGDIETKVRTASAQRLSARATPHARLCALASAPRPH